MAALWPNRPLAAARVAGSSEQECAGASSGRRGQTLLKIAAGHSIDQEPAAPAARGHAVAGLLGDAVALAIAAGLAILAIGIADSTASGATRLLAVVTLPALLAPLFGGAEANRLAALPSHVLAWALGTFLLATAVWLAAGGWPPSRSIVPLLFAFGLVITARLALIVAAEVLRTLGAARDIADEWARWLVVATLWLLTAAPLWLGPLADLQARDGTAAAEAIVAASPLVHLGLAAGQDVLRTQWFYANSSLGSLQFDYPSLTSVALGYACAAAVLALLAVGFARRGAAAMPAVHASSPN